MNRELCDKEVKFHGHECPGLAIGVKVCEAVMEKMGIEKSEDEEIVCVTENDACGVDAIQAILGCSLGKGNLIYKDTGKQAFSFFNRRNGDKLRMYFRPKYNGDDKKEKQNYILNASVDEIFEFSKPKFDLPEEARIFKSVECDNCKEKSPENKMHIQDGKLVCDDCFKSYTRGW